MTAYIVGGLERIDQAVLALRNFAIILLYFCGQFLHPIFQSLHVVLLLLSRFLPSQFFLLVLGVFLCTSLQRPHGFEG
jgi:hypothetical protein